MRSNKDMLIIQKNGRKLNRIFRKYPNSPIRAYFWWMKKSIAIAGIHTGIGKTVAAAVLAEAMDADYWKPVQAGTEERDMLRVGQLLTNGDSRVHKEAVLLAQAMSPHAAAQAEGINIDYKKFAWPMTKKTLLVETAGGVLSPMSADQGGTNQTTMADFISYYNLPTLLVVQNYLGSINHTLLTLEVIKQKGINLIGIVMNGAENTASETFITQYSRVPVIARVPQFEKLDNGSVAAEAQKIKKSLSKYM